jgi:phospholipid/cholesterol/gamma-HCH transport system substrate-binding protein
MSKKANPAVIGIFVLGAACLVVAGVLALGSGKLFEKTEKYVMFFEGDLGGLDVGAPVQYRGMRIGQVTEMRLELNVDTGDTLIPVFIEIEEGRMTFTGSVRGEKGMKFQVDERGVRGQLQTDSLITGKKKVALVEDPGSPMRRVGAIPSLFEIPTVPTVEEAFLKKLEDLPFQSIVSNLNATLISVSTLAGSPEVKGAVKSISQSSDKLDSLLSKLEDTIPDLVKSTAATAEETRGLLLGIKPAMTNLEPIMVSAKANLDALHEVEVELVATLAEAKSLMSERSPIRYDLTMALERVGSAADSIRQFMDYLQRHPEAFLAGKGTMKNNRSDP